MAVIQNPIIGRSKNQAGGMIFQTQRGQNTMRARPLTVANPRTEKQRIQRNRLATLSYLGRVMRNIYLLGFREVQGVASQWNKFVQANILTATQSDPDDVLVVNTEELIVADGSLSNVIITNAVFDTSGLTIDYDPNKVTSDDNDNDVVSIIAFVRQPLSTVVTSFQSYVTSVDSKIGGFSGTAQRDTGQIVLSWENIGGVAGTEIDAYIFTASQISNKVSVSALTSGTITL